MATITTKFAIGDTAWRIYDSRATCFEIGCILYDGVTVYYGATAYDTTPEALCFATKEELIKYVAADGE